MVNGYKPLSLAEALEIRASRNVMPYAGGTDIMVRNPKDACFLFLDAIEELKEIKDDGEYIRIGAGVTFTKALGSDLVPPLMKEAISRIAAPAIRNAGTFGGNLGNGSDKADSVLADFALDAVIRLVSVQGERLLHVDEFCVRRGVTALRDDELIAEILLPKSKCAQAYYYKKVGGRNALAISHIAFAAAYEISGGVIQDISFAAINDTGVIRRCRDIEEALIGKSVDEVKVSADEVVQQYAQTMTFTRGRVTAEYRRTVTMNLLRDFLESLS